MEDELTISTDSVTNVKQMLLEVPNPTVDELQKLLAVQGHILNSLGIGLITESKRHMKFSDKRAYIKMALDCLRESRFALDSAVKAEDFKKSRIKRAAPFEEEADDMGIEIIE
jgi:hypothetical protein